MEIPPAFIVFVMMVVAAVAIVVTVSSRSRRGGAGQGQQVCAGCGATNPGMAQFCRRCGQRLGGDV